MKNGVAPLPELRPGIGAMNIDHDIGRIEQNDQVLREIGQCIHLQILIRQQYRSSFGDAAAGARYRMIDISQNPGIPAVARSNSPRTSGAAEQTSRLDWSSARIAVAASLGDPERSSARPCVSRLCRKPL